MNKSNTISKLAAALVKAQAEMPVVIMDSLNPFLRNKYATLGAIISAARPILAKHGLSITQFPVSQENRIGVTSTLIHESGEWLEETIMVFPETAKGLSINQSAGVSITYLKRYAYASILAIYADEDVDGDTKFGETVESEGANKQAEAIFHQRTWSNEQTEAIALMVIDAQLEPVTHEEVAEILNYSTLPGNAPIKTVQSWFKHYLKSEGANIFEKSADANQAYAKAKKGSK